MQSHVSGERPEMAAHLWSTGYSVSSSLKPASTALGPGRVVAVRPGRARCWVLRERALGRPSDRGASPRNAEVRAPGPPVS